MPRTARIVIPNVPYHVTQRSVDREQVFRDNADCKTYLSLLRNYAMRHRVKVASYCLMPNHIHLVLVPSDKPGLSKAVGRAHNLFSQRINHKYDRVGHLWQNRFFSCPVMDNHLWEALRYVEQNPLRAKMVRHASDFRWSSAAAHCGGSDELRILDWAWWNARMVPETWRILLGEPIGEEMLEQIRHCTFRNEVLGEEPDGE